MAGTSAAEARSAMVSAKNARLRSNPATPGWRRRVSAITASRSRPPSRVRIVGNGKAWTNGSAVATTTSWPASTNACASGSIGYRCPYAGIAANSTRIPALWAHRNRRRSPVVTIVGAP